MDVQVRSWKSNLTYRSKSSNMVLKVPGRPGADTDMAEGQPNHIPDPQHATPEGSRGIPPTINERANPPPDSHESDALA